MQTIPENHSRGNTATLIRAKNTAKPNPEHNGTGQASPHCVFCAGASASLPGAPLASCAACLRLVAQTVSRFALVRAAGRKGGAK